MSFPEPRPPSVRALPAALAISALLIAACIDGPTPPPPHTNCDGVEIDVLAPARYEGIIVPATAVECFALAGAGASYLVLPQLTGATLPYGGYGYRIGDPSATALLREGAPAQIVEPPTPEADAQQRLDGLLRQRELHAAMRGRMPRAGARLASAATGERAAPAGLLDPGSTRTFSVLATLDASPSFASVGATLRFVGERVLIYVDTVAAGAFTGDEIYAMGVLHDVGLAPLIHDAFGAGSDLDANGRVILLMTPVVNAMVSASACAASGYVRGFFHPHDLASSAPTSNQGEIFYAYVPDPSATWSCAHAKADVAANLPPTFVHELQHLISYGEHAVLRAGASEEPWLNEGLSHVAEELGSRFFEERYPAPLGRADPDQIFPDSSGPFITPNLIYSYRFVFSSPFYSVTTCAPGSFCSLAERGAAWTFLRWLADRFGAATLRELVETPLTGRANLESVVGAGTGELLGDFAIAISVDSLPGLPRTALADRHRFQSRNFRLLYRALYETYGLPYGISRPFPSEPLPLGAGASLTGTMRPGSFAPYRVTTPVGTPVLRLRFSSVDGTPFPSSSGAQVAIFRLQ